MFPHQYTYNLFASTISLNPIRLRYTILGSICLIYFLPYYNVITIFLMCVKLATVVDVMFLSSMPFISSILLRTCSKIDVGWFLVKSSSLILILRIGLKSAQYILKILNAFLDRLELSITPHLPQIIFIEIIGVAFIIDSDLYCIQMVLSS
jgi:hypothetical protein